MQFIEEIAGFAKILKSLGCGVVDGIGELNHGDLTVDDLICQCGGNVYVVAIVLTITGCESVVDTFVNGGVGIGGIVMPVGKTLGGDDYLHGSL